MLHLHLGPLGVTVGQSADQRILPRAGIGTSPLGIKHDETLEQAMST